MIAASVPLFLYIIIVLALLGAHGLTVLMLLRRNRDLRILLNAKMAMLHEAPCQMSTVRLERNMKCDIGGRVVWADRPCTLTIGAP